MTLTEPERELAVRGLASAISGTVRKIRLERIGEDPDQPHLPFDEMPDEDQANWVDVATAVFDLINLTRIEADAQGAARVYAAEHAARWVQPGTSLTAPRAALEEIAAIGTGFDGKLEKLLAEAKFDTIWITVADSGVMRFTQEEVNRIAGLLGLGAAG